MSSRPDRAARGAGDVVVRAAGLRREFVVRRPAGRFRRDRITVAAVDGIDLEIRRGECVGFIGANGAGKSTTIKMITGILTPTGGSVTTCGLEPVRQRRALAARIGVVFGQRSQLWWDLPLRESFRLLAAIHRLPADGSHAGSGSGSGSGRLAECVELLDLGAFLDTPVRQLSLGQRMRGEVTAALLHSPELLVLDEPTIGLDVVSKERLREFLAAEQRTRGTTILLTTHDLPDIDRLADRILVVDAGRVAFAGTRSELDATVGAERVLALVLDGPAPPLAVPGARVVRYEADGTRQDLALAPGMSAAAAIAAVSATVGLRDLAVREPDITDVVRRLYERSAAERA